MTRKERSEGHNSRGGEFDESTEEKLAIGAN